MTWPKITIVVIVSSVLGVILASLTYYQKISTPRQGDFFLNNKLIHLEIAQSPEEQYQGLSDRPSLCSECGMLFVSAKSSPQTFVMRRMNFPLDIIWINQGVIMGISKDLSPEHIEPYTPYNSPTPVNWVLELNAGRAQDYNLQVGQKLHLTIKN